MTLKLFDGDKELSSFVRKSDDHQFIIEVFWTRDGRYVGIWSSHGVRVAFDRKTGNTINFGMLEKAFEAHVVEKFSMPTGAQGFSLLALASANAEFMKRLGGSVTDRQLRFNMESDEGWRYWRRIAGQLESTYLPERSERVWSRE